MVIAVVVAGVMKRVIIDCEGKWEEKQLLTLWSKLSAKLRKADLMPMDEPTAGRSGLKAPALLPLTEKEKWKHE